MPVYDKEELREIEVFPGVRGKLVHTDQLTVADFRLDAGTFLPEHSHPHEQISTVLSGEFEFVIGGELHRCKAGKVAAIPPNVLHSGRAITDCRIIDVFSPAREDYRVL